MFGVTVRDRVLVAHSLRGELFGPAQRLHGATYVVEATFARGCLDEHGLVVDIGRAAAVLRDLLEPLDHSNLDEDPALAGMNTTTEALAGVVADRLVDAALSGALGAPVEFVSVTMRESDIAWASCERRVLDPGVEPR